MAKVSGGTAICMQDQGRVAYAIGCHVSAVLREACACVFHHAITSLPGQRQHTADRATVSLQANIKVTVFTQCWRHELPSDEQGGLLLIA